MSKARRLGADEERAASRYLAGLGYTIITRNYKRGRSEIDLVAMDGKTVVFIEVRARKKGGRQSAEESIDIAKQERLWETADQYLAEAGVDHLDARFDVIAIEGQEIRHYVDAFRPD